MSPPVNYLTLLDQYSLGQIFFMLLAFFIHGIIGFLTYDCDTLSGDCTPRAGPFGIDADDDVGSVDI